MGTDGKSTPYAAQVAADTTARKAMEHGLRQIEVFVKGPGSGGSGVYERFVRQVVPGELFTLTFHVEQP